MKKFNHKHFYILFLLFFLSVVIFIVIVNLFDLNANDFFLPCLFYKRTGIYCPGCGCTRATISLIKGNIIPSLYYNPVILYSAVIFVWAILSYIIRPFIKKEKWNIFLFRYSDWYVWIGLILFLGTFVIRNILALCFHIWII